MTSKRVQERNVLQSSDTEEEMPVAPKRLKGIAEHDKKSYVPLFPAQPASVGHHIESTGLRQLASAAAG